METPRKIGAAIDFAVPAIVGAGLVHYFSESWPAVVIFEILLLIILISVISEKEA